MRRSHLAGLLAAAVLSGASCGGKVVLDHTSGTSGGVGGTGGTGGTGGGGIGGSSACQVCGDALANGTDGDFCTATDESDYDALQSCGCSNGPCADVCSGDFCTDSGDGPDCDACLSDNCGPLYDNCNAD